MTKTRLKSLFTILIENVARILEAGFGVESVESALFEILWVTSNYEDSKEVLLGLIEGEIPRKCTGEMGFGSIPLELLELLIHEYKWKEIIELVESSDSRSTTKMLADELREAMSDEWKGREMYRHYTNKH